MNKDEIWGKICIFSKENGIPMYQIARISREIATCDKCKFYCQHYDINGAYVPYGHCIRFNNRLRKPHEANCANWEYREVEE